jgi:hypothetical protein
MLYSLCCTHYAVLTTLYALCCTDHTVRTMLYALCTVLTMHRIMQVLPLLTVLYSRYSFNVVPMKRAGFCMAAQHKAIEAMIEALAALPNQAARQARGGVSSNAGNSGRRGGGAGSSTTLSDGVNGRAGLDPRTRDAVRRLWLAQ